MSTTSLFCLLASSVVIRVLLLPQCYSGGIALAEAAASIATTTHEEEDLVFQESTDTSHLPSTCQIRKFPSYHYSIVPTEDDDDDDERIRTTAVDQETKSPTESTLHRLEIDIRNISPKNLNVNVDYDLGTIHVLGWLEKSSNSVRGEVTATASRLPPPPQACIYQEWNVAKSIRRVDEKEEEVVDLYSMVMELQENGILQLSLPVTAAFKTSAGQEDKVDLRKSDDMPVTKPVSQPSISTTAVADRSSKTAIRSSPLPLRVAAESKQLRGLVRIHKAASTSIAIAPTMSPQHPETALRQFVPVSSTTTNTRRKGSATPGSTSRNASRSEAGHRRIDFEAKQDEELFVEEMSYHEQQLLALERFLLLSFGSSSSSSSNNGEEKGVRTTARTS